MSEAAKYRQYARDCIRIADGMNGKDRQRLLDIAEAWEGACGRGRGRPHKTDGRGDPDAPSVVPEGGA